MRPPVQGQGAGAPVASFDPHPYVVLAQLSAPGRPHRLIVSPDRPVAAPKSARPLDARRRALMDLADARDRNDAKEFVRLAKVLRTLGLAVAAIAPRQPWGGR